jgi:hypothetical protein
MGAPELQSNWPEMRKTLGKPGFCSTGIRKLTEGTGTELFDVFPIFLKSSKGKIVGQRILDEISCLSRLPRQTPAVTDLNAMLSVASSRDHQRRP